MELRPYQAEVAKAILESIQRNRGLTFSVEIARQGGKNELSAHLEVLLLTMFMSAGGNAVKCSPTFKPQTIISMSRLKERLDDFGFAGSWFTEAGYMLRLGNARQIFLSAEESASVVGHTADILLEIDESQDVAKDKYTKEFRLWPQPPMSPPYTTGRRGTTALCLKKSSRLTLSWKRRTALSATSDSTGRKSASIAHTIRPLLRPSWIDWGRIIRSLEPNTPWYQSVVGAGC